CASSRRVTAIARNWIGHDRNPGLFLCGRGSVSNRNCLRSRLQIRQERFLGISAEVSSRITGSRFANFGTGRSRTGGKIARSSREIMTSWAFAHPWMTFFLAISLIWAIDHIVTSFSPPERTRSHDHNPTNLRRHSGAEAEKVRV